MAETSLSGKPEAMCAYFITHRRAACKEMEYDSAFFPLQMLVQCDAIITQSIFSQILTIDTP